MQNPPSDLFIIINDEHFHMDDLEDVADLPLTDALVKIMQSGRIGDEFKNSNIGDLGSDAFKLVRKPDQSSLEQLHDTYDAYLAERRRVGALIVAKTETEADRNSLKETYLQYKMLRKLSD